MAFYGLPFSLLTFSIKTVKMDIISRKAGRRKTNKLPVKKLFIGQKNEQSSLFQSCVFGCANDARQMVISRRGT